MGKHSVGSSTNNLSLSLSGAPKGLMGKVRAIYDSMMFGVLYSMVHGNNFSRKFFVLNIIVEFVQLLSFSFRGVFPWQPELGYLGFSLSFFKLPDNFLTYQTYTIVFWLVFVFVWLSIANAALVGYGFHHQAYRFIWSIRTLRWVTSVLVSVLYIPVVIVFLTAISCNPATAKLTSFTSESITCLRVDNAIKAVLGIITLIVFTPFAFVNCATYYEHDPTIKFTYGQAHSRFDVVMLALKTVLTVCFAFGESVPWVLSLIMVVGLGIALMTSLLYMPMYNHRLNQMKTCSLAVVFWGALSTIVCLSINNRADKIPLYFFVAGIIPSFCAGYFLHRFRVASLRKLSLMSELKPSVDVAPVIPKGKVVTWATPVPTGILDPAAVERSAKKLRFANEVELIARLVLEEPQTPDVIQRAEAIYIAGIKRFPKSAIVIMSYIIFLMVYKRDSQRAYVLLEKLKKRGSPYFDIRFFLFRQDKDRERKVQLEGMGSEKGKFDDFVGYMQYQKLYTQAREGHLEVLKLVQKFWKLLAEDDVDMARLAHQAGKIATAEAKTEKVYLMLLNLYPSSPRILRDFAQFVDDILQEEDLVRMLVERADFYEETASKSRSKSPRKRNLDDDDEDDDVEDQKPHNFDDDLFEDKSMVSSTADLSQNSLQRKKMEMLNRNDNTSLKILSAVLIGCTVISLILAMVMVVTTTNQIDKYDHDINRMVSVSLMSSLGPQLSMDAREVAAHARAQDENYNYAKDLDSLLRRSVIFKNILQAVAWGQNDLSGFTPDRYKQVAGLTNTIDIGSRVFAYKEYNVSESAAVTSGDGIIHNLFYDPSLDIRTVTGSDGRLTESRTKWGIWPAGRLLGDYAQVVGTYNYDIMQNISAGNEEYNYVVLNGGEGVADGLGRLVDAFTTVATQGLYGVLVASYVTYAVASFVTIVTGVFVFRPVVLKVVAQKSHTLALFLKVPPDVVHKMVRRNGKLIKSFKVSLDGPQLVVDEEGEFGVEEENDDDDDVNYTKKSPITCTVTDTQLDLTQTQTQTQTSTSSSTPTKTLSQTTSQSLLGTSQINLTLVSSGSIPALLAKPSHESSSSITPLLQKPASKSSYESNDETHKVIVINHSNSGSSSGSGSSSARMSQKRSKNSKAFTRGFAWLHVAYSAGLFFILVCFTVLLITMQLSVQALSTAAPSINMASVRSRSTRSLGNNLMGFILPETRNISRSLLKQDITSLLNIQQQIEAAVSDLGNDVGVDDLYTSTCLLQKQSDCRSTNDPYYADVSQGLSHLIYTYVAAIKRVMTFSDAQLSTAIFHPDVNWVLHTCGNDLVDGGHRYTSQLAKFWANEIYNCKQVIGGVVGVVLFLFIVEYFAFFRTLLARLRNESQNTYAMLQMIPKKELANIRELFELTNNI